MQLQTTPGKISITEEDVSLGEMKIFVNDGILTALHTESFPAGEGKGIGKKLFAGMIEYAEKEGLKLKAHCSFVQAMLKRDPDRYKDLIVKSED